MIVTFQVILLAVIIMSFLGVFEEKDNTAKEMMLGIFLAGLAAFIVSVLWL